MILSREQVYLLNYEDAKKAQRQLEKSKLLDKPLTKLSLDEYQLIEDLSNTYLYLEDRIRDFEDLRMTTLKCQVTQSAV